METRRTVLGMIFALLPAAVVAKLPARELPVGELTVPINIFPGAIHWVSDWYQCDEIDEEALKTHPCCVPFVELPAEQKAKDVLFKGIVDALRSLI